MQYYNDDTTWATPSQQVEPNVGKYNSDRWGHDSVGMADEEILPDYYNWL
jgi:hypothetical protein